MKKEKSCGAIIYNTNNEVLIIKHNKGHWDFPKGHIEINETELETAIREVKEETNLDIKIYADYRYVIHYNPELDIEKTVVFFLARNISDNIIKQDEEVAIIDWFNYKEAMNILTYDTAKQLLKKSYKDINNI